MASAILEALTEEPRLFPDVCCGISSKLLETLAARLPRTPSLVLSVSTSTMYPLPSAVPDQLTSPDRKWLRSFGDAALSEDQRRHQHIRCGSAVMSVCASPRGAYAQSPHHHISPCRRNIGRNVDILLSKAIFHHRQIRRSFRQRGARSDGADRQPQRLE